MGKRLFLLIIASLIGVINAPRILMATDTVGVTGLNPEGIVETVPLPEPEPEPEPVVTKAPVAGAQQAPVPQVVNYTVTIYTSSIVADNLSYGDIYKTNKLVYGHNTMALLGSLRNLSVGQVFTITEGGAVKSYRASDKVTYDKTADGYLNGNAALMGSIMRTALGHDVALLTCAGEPRGNGDATQRLVVYADAV